MNVSQLEQELKQLGVPQWMYFLEHDGLPNEAYCLAKKESWEVYYSERGRKFDLQCFSTETEACEYLLKKLRKYGTVKALNGK